MLHPASGPGAYQALLTKPKQQQRMVISTMLLPTATAADLLGRGQLTSCRMEYSNPYPHLSKAGPSSLQQR